MLIRTITENDCAACAEIYNHYILQTTVTFETEAISAESFRSRANDIRKSYPYLVYEDEAGIEGYCYLNVFNERAAYCKTCDLSVYIREGFSRRGIGQKLFDAIVPLAEKAGFRQIISLITSENAPSVAFHERNGFRKVGILYDAGEKFGKRLGVYYYQKAIGDGMKGEDADADI